MANIKLKIKYEGNLYDIEVPSDSTLIKVKEAIIKEIPEAETSRQKLIFGGN